MMFALLRLDAYEGWHALTRYDLVGIRWMAGGMLIADMAARA